MTGTVFRNGERYVRIELDTLRQMAESETIDRATRLWFLAAGNANQDGHAPMPGNRLAQLLSIGGKPAQSSDISRAIKTAKDRKLIGPESRSTCLTVNHQEVSQGYGRRGCDVHDLHHVDAKGLEVD